MKKIIVLLMIVFNANMANASRSFGSSDNVQDYFGTWELFKNLSYEERFAPNQMELLNCKIGVKDEETGNTRWGPVQIIFNETEMRYHNPKSILENIEPMLWSKTNYFFVTKKLSDYMFAETDPRNKEIKALNTRIESKYEPNIEIVSDDIIYRYSGDGCTDIYHRKIFKPSFNCAKSSTYVERLICGFKDLAEKDVKLNKIYKEKLTMLNDSSKLEDLKKSQREWIKERNYCKVQIDFTTGCLKQQYSKRIKELENI